jgi:hypothetical protein
MAKQCQVVSHERHSDIQDIICKITEDRQQRAKLNDSHSGSGLLSLKALVDSLVKAQQPGGKDKVSRGTYWDEFS